jgi:oxygen-dependent protoporphyrinogen oxidase
VAGVRVRHPDGTAGELEGAGVILATAANTAAALTATAFPALSEPLRSINYYPVSLVIAEYERPVFSPAVRAIVFDQDQPLSNAGAYGVNDLHLVRYTFSGRAFRRGRPGTTSPDALLGQAEAALGRYVPLAGNPRRRFVARQFDTGLCAYTARHDRFLDRIDEELGRIDGLYLTGDYIQGASIEACFRAASACARQLVQREHPSRPAATGRDRHQLLTH